jgi:tRNA pseudouridine55 synthase
MSLPPIHALLLLDKPKGLSSNQALQKVKRMLGLAKAGHCGTLDPLATGMLPLSLGEATKFSSYILDETKRYVFTAKLGQETTTGDTEGDILADKPYDKISEQMIVDSLAHFRGEISQIPPMYSALKYQGQPLYKLARKGVSVERLPRQVYIDSLTLIDIDWPYITLDVVCSKGTYVRTLVSDLGHKLGCGAHVTALRRLEIGQFLADEMVTLEELESCKEDYDALVAHLLSIDSMVHYFQEVHLTSQQTFYFLRGQSITYNPLPESELYRVYDSDENFLGLGERTNDIQLKPQRLVKLL